MQPNVKAVDLFCGVGGLTCGLRQAGIKVVSGIDIDETCKYAYEHNNNAIFYTADVGTFDSDTIKKDLSGAKVKALVGCAPCQPFSNHQKNKKDRSKNKKWPLLYSFLKQVKEVNPDIVSMENVPELTKEKVFIDFTNGLESLGYFVSFKIVNAADYGVPERRTRLLLLASKFGAISLIEPTCREKHRTVFDAIHDLEPLKDGQISAIDPLHRARKLSELNLRRIQHSVPGGTWMDWPENLRPKCYLKKSGLSYQSVYGRMKWDDVSPTLTTQFSMYGTGRYGHPEQNRALSLREGAIIQTFPPDYSFIEDPDNVHVTTISRQIGNAVPVKLGEAVGKSILLHLRKVGAI